MERHRAPTALSAKLWPVTTPDSTLFQGTDWRSRMGENDSHTICRFGHRRASFGNEQRANIKLPSHRKTASSSRLFPRASQRRCETGMCVRLTQRRRSTNVVDCQIVLSTVPVAVIQSGAGVSRFLRVVEESVVPSSNGQRPCARGVLAHVASTVVTNGP